MSQDEKNAVMVKYLEDNWETAQQSNTSQSTTTVPLEGDPGFIGPIQQTGVATGAETATGSGTTVPSLETLGLSDPFSRQEQQQLLGQQLQEQQRVVSTLGLVVLRS